ncbi:MAG: nucleotidyltransferase [Deltaproteobacteria bacterium]|nr:nucleotidyltransferase [Deltaproteobacteria bacterium]
MADLQKYFEQFHTAIAVRRSQEKAILSEKRERVLRRLSDGIARQREQGIAIPSYRTKNQGSYRMGTGIRPKDQDYDIDVAVIFDLAPADHPDPVVVKSWVMDALEGHTKRVEMRRPCVTVFYQAENEPIYHVDLAVYAEGGDDEKIYLALGKPESAPEFRVWQESDPEALIAIMDSRFADSADGAQFRRCIRYLKRWRDENFVSSGNGAPRGIALTACALRWFTTASTLDAFRNTRSYDDLTALARLVRMTLGAFTSVYDAETQSWVQRLSVALPVPPGNDLFERMTNGQMVTLHDRLDKLWNALDQASRDPDPHTAAATLRKVLGEDFPVPDKAETADKRAPAIVSSGNSGLHDGDTSRRRPG